ncbi:HET-domain-containing protein [Cubamyces sp. BRFM 1775]|nr:HET-domain-containing protein [Cubamyces sp. BRFM 1775]
MSAERHPTVTLASSNELPPRPDHVCARCWEGVFVARFGLQNDPVTQWAHSWYGGFEYTLSYDEFQLCKESNCSWFCLLDRGFRSHSGTPGWPDDSTSSSTLHFRVGKPFSWSSKRDEELIVVYNDRRTFKLSIQADDADAAWLERWTRVPCVERLDLVALAKAYVYRCLQNHECCRDSCHTESEVPLPARLIDCSDPVRPRVIETRGGTGGDHVYVALSYVWGEESQPHRTTTDNLRSYLDAIESSSLPQTISDAIRVTRALGVRYLWVDSLCIIQDSREDKHRELAKMRTVYRHAYLTIDAANAKKVSQGFLDGRIPVYASIWLPFIWSQRLKGVEPQNKKPLVTSDDDPVDDHCDHADSHALYLSESATRYGRPSDCGYTGQRAWCLQEILVSKRHLLFADQTLQFRCRSTIQDVGVHRVNEDPLMAQWTVTDAVPDVVFQPPSSVLLYSEDWFTIHWAWLQVVMDYTRRSLSYSSDKLVACAGLAEEFACALGTQVPYLAGLWRDSLLCDLLWFVAPDKIGSRGDGRAPSWSWAASDHAVSFQYAPTYRIEYWKSREELTEVVGCTTTLEDSALPFGPVTDGHLVLCAPLLGPYMAEDWPAVTRLIPAEVQVSDGEHRCSDPITPGHGLTSLVMDAVCSGEGDHGRDQRLWLLPLIYQPYHVEQCSSLVNLVVRVVEKTDACHSSVFPKEGDKVTYRRMGYCELDLGVYESYERLADALRHKTDGIWVFPRAQIELV